MCRLALFLSDKEGRDVSLLEEAIFNLNAHQGGDGMGVALFPPKASAQIWKSTDMSPEWAAKKIAERPPNTPALWHCRLSTTERKDNESCHPFHYTATRRGVGVEIVFAHNGGWSSWKEALLILGHKKPAISDSDLLARIVAIRSHRIIKLLLSHGAFIYAIRSESVDWHFHVLRLGHSDLRPLEFGGVISAVCKLPTGIREVPNNKWLRLRSNHAVPMVEEYSRRMYSLFRDQNVDAAGQSWVDYFRPTNYPPFRPEIAQRNLSLKTLCDFSALVYNYFPQTTSSMAKVTISQECEGQKTIQFVMTIDVDNFREVTVTAAKKKHLHRWAMKFFRDTTPLDRSGMIRALIERSKPSGNIANGNPLLPMEGGEING